VSDRSESFDDDAELDDFWETEVGAVEDTGREDAEEPEDDVADDDESSDYDDEDDEDDAEFSDDEADDEEDDDDEDDDGDDEPEETPQEILARERAQLAQQAQAAADALKKKFDEEAAAVLQEKKRLDTAQQLIQLRATMNDEDWQKFTGRLFQGFAAFQQKEKDTELQRAKTVIQAFARRDEMIESQAAQTAMREAALTKAREIITGKSNGQLDPVEERLLQTAGPDQFMGAIESIQARRQGMTEPARQALRERRQAKQSDRTPLRSTNGSNGRSDDYDNFDPDAFDDYVDDVFAARSKPRRGSRAVAR
jgi:hypothetical protein